MHGQTMLKRFLKDHLATRYSDEFEINGRTVQVRRSARRKKSMSMRLDQGTLIVMVPARTPDQKILDWVRQKTSWIEQQAAKAVPAREYAVGATFYFSGQPLMLQHCDSPQNATIQRRDNRLCVRPDKTDAAQIRAGVRSWYQREAQACLPQRLDALSMDTGLLPQGLEIKYYKARWGSCTEKGMIQLNWRLMMVPESVVDYVIVHELCHLKHFNHSPAFWALVASHCVDYKAQRQWLKDHAAQLTLP